MNKLAELRQNLALEESGKPFNDEKLEAVRQSQIVLIIDLIIEENARILDACNKLKTERSILNRTV